MFSRLYREALEERGLSLLDVLEELRGKHVRVVIEDRRIMIEIPEE